jgi:hypothetical protein
MHQLKEIVHFNAGNMDMIAKMMMQGVEGAIQQMLFVGHNLNV